MREDGGEEEEECDVCYPNGGHFTHTTGKKGKKSKGMAMGKKAGKVNFPEAGNFSCSGLGAGPQPPPRPHLGDGSGPQSPARLRGITASAKPVQGLAENFPN